MTVRELYEALGRIISERAGADMAPVDIVEKFPNEKVSVSVEHVADVGNGRVVVVAPAIPRR